MAKVALLIGVSEYEPGLNPLPAAVRDIEAMRRVLEDPEMGGFDTVKLLSNPDHGTMQYEIEILFNEGRARDNLVLLFFSGHGIKDDLGKLYFASRQTRKNTKGDLIRSSAVPAGFVHDIMNNSRAKRQVIILDCCFSGAFDPALRTKDDGSVDLQTQLGAEGRAVLASSSSTQYSFEHEGADLSLYTRYLVEGIETGAGDQNSDGFVSMLELHEYAASKVTETAPKMTPKIIVLKDKGFEIVLAKARVADPKLKYRRAAEQYVNKGTIRPAGRALLNRMRQQLGLTEEDTNRIESELLRPFRERMANLQLFRETLIKEAEQEYPVSEQGREAMAQLREQLGLGEEDITTIWQDIEKQFAQDVMSEDDNICGRKYINRELYHPYIFKTNDQEFLIINLIGEIILEAILLPGGEFLMGSIEGEGFADEYPQHRVSVPPFYIGKFPVTQEQWDAIASVCNSLSESPSFFRGSKRPVECVSWYESVNFCNELSQKSGKKFRLPTEAEWEYACRAESQASFWWGENISVSNCNHGYHHNGTTNVDRFQRNKFGLYDMHGNTWEWCLDGWHETYDGAPINGSCWENINEHSNSSLKILRGGSWDDPPKLCRSANRGKLQPLAKNNGVGFRVVCEYQVHTSI